jgi:hypothetical protein
MKPFHIITVSEFNVPVKLYPDSWALESAPEVTPTYSFSCDLYNHAEVIVNEKEVARRGFYSYSESVKMLLRKIKPGLDSNEISNLAKKMETVYNSIPRIEVEARNVVKTYDDKLYIVVSVYPTNVTVISMDVIESFSIARHWIKEVVIQDVNDILSLTSK